MQDRPADRLPVGDVPGVQAESLTEPQRQRGQAVTTALVPGKGGLVDEHHGPASSGEEGGRGRPGRPTTHHYDVYQPVGWPSH